MVATTIRTLFAQPTAEAVRVHLDTVADMLGEQFPKVKEMLLDAKEDLTATSRQGTPSARRPRPPAAPTTPCTWNASSSA